MLEVKDVNYSATIVNVDRLVELEGADRMYGVPFFGMQALVSKTSVCHGQLGVLFPTECQLSEDYCRENNLYSNNELNANKEIKGYIGSNRRVRAIKLRGHNSNCLFMPLKSLEAIGINVHQLKAGDTFNSIDGIEVCKKYIIKEYHLKSKGPKISNKKESRAIPKLIPEHIDTENWWRNEYKIDMAETIIVTQKLHGTSVRLAHQLCNRRLSLFERILLKLGVKVETLEYDYFAGSRRVIKDSKCRSYKDKDHYYTEDIYNRALNRFKDSIPKGYVVYGELVGWIGDSEIQKNYNYRIERGDFELYVYRVAQINPDGLSVDLSWEQVKRFCNESGIKHVPEIFVGEKRDFNVDIFMDVNFIKDLGLKQCVPLAEESPCDEGLAIRVEDITPFILKAKSPMFLGHETKMLDSDKVDIESQESITE
jgi:hypothetical protein